MRQCLNETISLRGERDNKENKPDSCPCRKRHRDSQRCVEQESQFGEYLAMDSANFFDNELNCIYQPLTTIAGIMRRGLTKR